MKRFWTTGKRHYINVLLLLLLLNFLNGHTKLAYCDEEPSFISLDVSSPLIVDPVWAHITFFQARSCPFFLRHCVYIFRPHIKSIFQSIAAKVGSDPCCDWVRILFNFSWFSLFLSTTVERVDQE